MLAFARPTTGLQPFAVPYQQHGTLSYSAQALPGPAYPGDRVVTGDPLFTRLVGVVGFRFAYRFGATAPNSLVGNASLDMTIASTSGWQRTVAFGRATRFRGDRALVTARLNLHSLPALLNRLAQATAVGGSYTLTIVPHVTATGSLAGLPLSTTFSPPFEFSLTPAELEPEAAGPVNLTGGQPPASPLDPSAPGSVKGRRNAPLFLSFRFVRLSVATARGIALDALAAVVCAIAVLLALVGLRRRDESAAIRSRYRRWLVPVAHVRQRPGAEVIEVEDMEALVRIATRYERMILHESREGSDVFCVADDGVVYRYAVGPEPLSTEEEPGAPGALTSLGDRSVLGVAEPPSEPSASAARIEEENETKRSQRDRLGLWVDLPAPGLVDPPVEASLPGSRAEPPPEQEPGAQELPAPLHDLPARRFSEPPPEPSVSGLGIEPPPEEPGGLDAPAPLHDPTTLRSSEPPLAPTVSVRPTEPSGEERRGVRDRLGLRVDLPARELPDTPVGASLPGSRAAPPAPRAEPSVADALTPVRGLSVLRVLEPSLEPPRPGSRTEPPSSMEEPGVPDALTSHGDRAVLRVSEPPLEPSESRLWIEPPEKKKKTKKKDKERGVPGRSGLRVDLPVPESEPPLEPSLRSSVSGRRIEPQEKKRKGKKRDLPGRSRLRVDLTAPALPEPPVGPSLPRSRTGPPPPPEEDVDTPAARAAS